MSSLVDYAKAAAWTSSAIIQLVSSLLPAAKLNCETMVCSQTLVDIYPKKEKKKVYFRLLFRGTTVK